MSAKTIQQLNVMEIEQINGGHIHIGDFHSKEIGSSVVSVEV
jgi:hypothetical protein